MIFMSNPVAPVAYTGMVTGLVKLRVFEAVRPLLLLAVNVYVPAAGMPD